jgi:putative FmdB family regulatory protein
VPKYDYRCSAGHLYEKREGFDAPAQQPCQVCGEQARRVLTPPAIVFKGSGWYVTDSRKSSSAASTDLPGSGTGTPDTAASTTETKSDTASTSTPAPPSAPAATD